MKSRGLAFGFLLAGGALALIASAQPWWRGIGEAAGVKFTPEQTAWLAAIKNHIAQSLAIEQADFEDVPFNQMGGLGKVYQLFGDKLPKMLDELNERLAA